MPQLVLAIDDIVGQHLHHGFFENILGIGRAFDLQIRWNSGAILDQAVIQQREAGIDAEVLEQTNAAGVKSHHSLVIAVQGTAENVAAIHLSIELIDVLARIIIFDLLPQVSRQQSFHLLGRVIDPPAMGEQLLRESLL